MSWENVVNTATAILDLQRERHEVAADEARANAVLARAAGLLGDNASEIVAPLTALGRLDLAADITARVDTFRAYAASPSGAQVRLVALIDATRSSLAELRQILASGPNEHPVIESYAPYSIVVAMQALAVTDKKYRFSPEPFGSLIENALVDADRVEKIFRRRSDLRFRFAARNDEPGFVTIGYTFDGVFRPVGFVPVRGDSSVARREALDEMAAERDRVFPAFPRVPELRAYARRLDDIEAFETVVVSQTEPVVAFARVQVVAGSAQPQRFELVQV